MKKRLNKIVKWFATNRLKVVEGLFVFIICMTMEVAAGYIAVKMKNYAILSCYTYVFVMVFVESFVKKYLFTKLHGVMLKSPSVTKFVFFLISAISIVLSCKYFIAFIVCTITAFIYGEFCRLESETKRKEY